MNIDFPLVLILFPANGLFVVFLWSLTMCNLIQGYVVTKKARYSSELPKYLIGLAVLCLANAFYIPTVLQYRFLGHVNINLPFWVGNLLVAGAVSIISIISAKAKGRIGPFKSLILCPVCAVFAGLVAANPSDFNVYGLYYLIFAVVIFPACYYLYAKSSQGADKKDENTPDSE